MKDRITQFLKSEGISPAEFADKIGVQRSSVSHVLNGRNYPSASFIQKMLGTYKTLNSRWLLLGEGTIFEPRSAPQQVSTLFSTSNGIENAVKDKEAGTKPEGVVPGHFPNQPADIIENKGVTDTGPKPANELNSSFSVPDFGNYIVENKEVDRIVFFFSDKTFSVYTPSK
jgi:transcriptional regulator with XRE-family HTH domain